ncbi:MAG: hypothetical protein K0S07_851 [Chlamydiales bacterium]|jgi:predicted RNA-binding protein YlqC (UPF0109 family)|nr:hypothetical protein [Chlamydiales bacterium]
MREFIEYLIKNLVDQPEFVDVRCLEGQKGYVVEVKVSEKDIGKVVGKNGNTIKALRTIAAMVGSRIGKHIRLELID